MSNNDQHSNSVTGKAGRGVIGPVLRRTAAAAALTLLVAGCSSGAGSAGSSSAASLTSGETSAPPATTVGGNSATATTKTLGETTASPTSTPASAVSSTGSLVAEAVLANPAGAQIGTVDFAVDGTVVTVTAQVDGLPRASRVSTSTRSANASRTAPTRPIPARWVTSSQPADISVQQVPRILATRAI